MESAPFFQIGGSEFESRRPLQFQTSRKDRSKNVPYKDPAKQREYQRLWYARRREFLLAELGGRCVSCGATESLEIDHIDRTKKRVATDKRGILFSYSIEWLKSELPNYQILCKPCHVEKTLRLGEWRPVERSPVIPPKAPPGTRAAVK